MAKKVASDRLGGKTGSKTGGGGKKTGGDSGGSVRTTVVR